MDGQEKLLDYETIKAAVAELPAGTRITIKRAAPSYAALRLSPAHPRNRYTRRTRRLLLFIRSRL